MGYGDFSPQTGAGRLFAIIFTLSATGLASYAISTLAAMVIRWEHDRVQRHIQEQRMTTIASLNNHIIVCGGGAISRKAMVFRIRLETSAVELILAHVHKKGWP